MANSLTFDVKLSTDNALAKKFEKTYSEDFGSLGDSLVSYLFDTEGESIEAQLKIAVSGDTVTATLDLIGNAKEYTLVTETFTVPALVAEGITFAENFEGDEFDATITLVEAPAA